MFTTLVLTLACSGLSWHFLQRQVAAATAALLQSGSLLARQLATTSRYSALVGDTTQLTKLAQDVLALDQVAYVIISTEARASADPLVTALSLESGGPQITSIGAFGLGGLVTLLSGQDVPLYYEESTPIRRAPISSSHDPSLDLTIEETRESAIDHPEPAMPAIGFVQVGLATIQLQTMLRTLLWHAVLITGLVILAGLVVMMVIAHRMTAPLQALAGVAKRVATGDFSAPLPPTTSDEIGELTRVFGDMTNSLHAREADLKELTNTLEARVATRTDELQAANAKLKELDQRKSLFVSTASHELRTSLTSMKVHLDNLLLGVDGPLTSDQSQVLTRVHVNLERLHHLMEELLDLSRIELGQMTVTLRPVDVPSTVDHIVATIKGLAGQKRVSIGVDVPRDLPPVSGDTDKMHQILTNLLHNAVKFSPEAGSIGVKAARGEDGYVTISVHDSGCGVPTAEAEKIFQPFYRSPTTPTPTRGTGLGLTIAKHLVELHRGRLWVDSQPGKGSCFTFTIPVWKGSEQTAGVR
ncbi:MAG: HAMP domain-containing histidine kinase [Nitrospirae bacterium]|nr:HAMP domain-containing histidine kinase [Nitrospirota bacterium]